MKYMSCKGLGLPEPDQSTFKTEPLNNYDAVELQNDVWNDVSAIQS